VTIGMCAESVDRLRSCGLDSGLLITRLEMFLGREKLRNRRGCCLDNNSLCLGVKPLGIVRLRSDDIFFNEGFKSGGKRRSFATEEIHRFLRIDGPCHYPFPVANHRLSTETRQTSYSLHRAVRWKELMFPEMYRCTKSKTCAELQR
jgi:hypothetical protein